MSMHSTSCRPGPSVLTAPWRELSEKERCIPPPPPSTWSYFCHCCYLNYFCFSFWIGDSPGCRGFFWRSVASGNRKQSSSRIEWCWVQETKQCCIQQIENRTTFSSFTLFYVRCEGKTKLDLTLTLNPKPMLSDPKLMLVHYSVNYTTLHYATVVTYTSLHYSYLLTLPVNTTQYVLSTGIRGYVTRSILQSSNNPCKPSRRSFVDCGR